MTHQHLKFYHSSVYVPYKVAVQHMQNYVQKMSEGKVGPCAWFLEHPPLYTAGMSAHFEDVLSPDFAPIFKTNRGGQITYHGPGQQVVYVMMPLKPFKNDVRAFMHFLEDWVIAVLEKLGVEGFRLKGKIGIWVEDTGEIKKIAACGVRVKKWISYHGIALNNTVDLKAFEAIVPCGIRDLGVTSLEALGISVSEADLQKILTEELLRYFFDKA